MANSLGFTNNEAFYQLPLPSKRVADILFMFRLLNSCTLFGKWGSGRVTLLGTIAGQGACSSCVYEYKKMFLNSSLIMILKMSLTSLLSVQDQESVIRLCGSSHVSDVRLQPLFLCSNINSVCCSSISIKHPSSSSWQEPVQVACVVSIPRMNYWVCSSLFAVNCVAVGVTHVSDGLLYITMHCITKQTQVH